MIRYFLFSFSFQSYILDASSVMRCLHCRFRVLSASYRLRQQPRHDSERAKPPPCSRCATLVPLPKQRKIIIRPDFGRSYRHLSFSKQPMKTGHSTLFCYIIPSLPHPVSPGYFQNRYRGKMLFQYSSVSMIYTSLDLHESPAKSVLY